MKRRIQLAPAEGWLTLGLVLIMCLTLARAIDDAHWVIKEEYLDHLIFAALGGVLCGFIGPKVGWGRGLTFLIGAIFAALFIPLLTGLVTIPEGASPHDLYAETASSAVAAYFDLTVRGLSSTPQFLHHVLILGLLVWGTSMFASYAVFGHHRPLGGIVVVGVLLVGNMAITTNDQLPFLIVYSLAALLLMLRSHVYDEEADWLRRRIGDPGSISAVYLRGGTMFIAITVIASFLLTQTAASAPLAGAWTGVESQLLQLSRAVAPLLPQGGSPRSLGLQFGPGQLGLVWTQTPGVALTITRDANDKIPYYWRVETHDQLEWAGRGHSQTASVNLPAGASIFEALADDVDPVSLHQIEYVVWPDAYSGPNVVAPVRPILIDEPVKVWTTGADGHFTRIEREGERGAYEVTALVSVPGNGPGELNDSALRATGTTYPEEISRLYLQLPDGILGEYATALRHRVALEAHSNAPIDLVNSAVDILKSNEYNYVTDIRNVDCSGVSRVECFAHYKRGFCQYYAGTMAAVLRDLGVPTRIVEGFLPGSRDGDTETIQSTNAHEWVEVYFTGYGWVTFDPTPAGVSQLTPLPSGPPQASATPGPSGSGGPQATPRDPRRQGDDGPSGSIVTGNRGSLGPQIVVGLLLLIVVATTAFLAWQRGPRGATNVDGAYGTVIRIASRLGFGPRPAETVYEYAGALGDVLPDSRPELQTVARAKVESAYGRQIMSDERLVGIQAAQRRLRVSLLRLALRRKDRRR
jgi:transglutaminase-like putative cysteine protease